MARAVAAAPPCRSSSSHALSSLRRLAVSAVVCLLAVILVPAGATATNLGQVARAPGSSSSSPAASTASSGSSSLPSAVSSAAEQDAAASLSSQASSSGTASTTFFPSFIAPSAGRITILSTNESYAARLAAFGPRLDDPGLTGWLIPIGKYAEGNERGCRRFDVDSINITRAYDPDGIADSTPRPTDPAGVPSDRIVAGVPSSPENPIHKPLRLIGSPSERLLFEQGVKPTGIPEGEPWIALVMRGECSFVEKVLEMEASGASAVIVGNNDNSGLITMYPSGDGRIVSIPSAFVAQLEYLQLKFRQPQMVILSRDPTPPWPILDVVIVTIVAPALLMGLLFTLWRYRAQARRRRAALAPAAAVLQLPTHTFCLDKRGPNDPETCAVCLEDFSDGEELRILPCRHEFHSGCIDPWLLTRRRTCPICKMDVAPVSERTPLLASIRSLTVGGSTNESDSHGAVATESTGAGVPRSPRHDAVSSAAFAVGVAGSYDSASSSPSRPPSRPPSSLGRRLEEGGAPCAASAAIAASGEFGYEGELSQRSSVSSGAPALAASPGIDEETQTSEAASVFESADDRRPLLPRP